MHAIIALYSRAYLTAALQDIPEEQHANGEFRCEAAAVLPAPAKLPVLARMAAWLRREWQAIRDELAKGEADRPYWPSDL